MRRKWAGINDDGGLAKITKIDEENETYDVKYILDNRKVKGIKSIGELPLKMDMSLKKMFKNI